MQPILTANTNTSAVCTNSVCTYGTSRHANSNRPATGSQLHAWHLCKVNTDKCWAVQYQTSIWCHVCWSLCTVCKHTVWLCHQAYMKHLRNAGTHPWITPALTRPIHGRMLHTDSNQCCSRFKGLSGRRYQQGRHAQEVTVYSPTTRCAGAVQAAGCSTPSTAAAAAGSSSATESPGTGAAAPAPAASRCQSDGRWRLKDKRHSPSGGCCGRRGTAMQTVRAGGSTGETRQAYTYTAICHSAMSLHICTHASYIRT